MENDKEKAERYFGVDIDRKQRQWDLTHSYERRDFEKEYVRLYRALKQVYNQKDNK